MNAQVSTLPTPLDRLACKLSNLLQQDAAGTKTEAEIKAARKALPWEMGAGLAEARLEFGKDDRRYGAWVCRELIEKFPTYKLKRETLTNYKNLSINFGHLRPEIETFKVTKLYKLNAWAEQFETRSSITLAMVKEKLSESKKITEEKPEAGEAGRDQVPTAKKITEEKPKTPETPKMEIVDPTPEWKKAREKQSEVGRLNEQLKKARDSRDKAKAEAAELKKEKRDFNKEVYAKSLEMIKPSVEKLKEERDALQKDKSEFHSKKAKAQVEMRNRIAAANKSIVDTISWTFDMDAKTVLHILTTATHPDGTPSVEKRTKAQALLNEARRRLFPK